MTCASLSCPDPTAADRLMHGEAAGLLRAPHDDAAIERAARALYVRDGRGTDRDYDALNDAGIHARYWNDAAALLAAS